ncbi:growth/differentiation factor 15 [Zootoca vivipara]|uniref:growth/differentiation factor 15 n=1 Tax=Zootoca vivipara TaxID=8524 RepID=UPI0015904626|nr:growth/differentiation factor 15 [Zootoca vivipara]
MPGASRLATSLWVLFLQSLLSGMVDLRPHSPQDAHPQLEAIKRSILDRLGMEKPPSVPGALGQGGLQEARQVYQEMLAQLRANQTLPPAAKTVHTLRAKVKLLGQGLAAGTGDTSDPLRPLYGLEVSRTAALSQGLHVFRAELTLSKKFPDIPGISQLNSTGLAHVNIYRLAGGDGETPVLLSSQVVSRTTPVLNLGDAVGQWLASPDPRLHLGLEFPMDVAASTLEGREWLPLEVETQGRRRVRKPRQLDEECGKGDTKCCLRSLKVSFADIGWSDWVLAPSSYSMRFCEGSCPHNYKPASMHAQIKARLHSLSGETPAPCCVPAAYEPMVLMHYASDGKVVTQLFDDMIVTRCHCA